ESHTESAIVAASTAGAKKAELLIKTGNRTIGRNAMIRAASLPTRNKTVKDRSGLTAQNHPIIALIQKEGADRIPASLMRSLTRTALTKDGEENPLLVKIFRNEVKILQSKNVHLIVLAVNGRKRHIL